MTLPPPAGRHTCFAIPNEGYHTPTRLVLLSPPVSPRPRAALRATRTTSGVASVVIPSYCRHSVIWHRVCGAEEGA